MFALSQEKKKKRKIIIEHLNQFTKKLFKCFIFIWYTVFSNMTDSLGVCRSCSGFQSQSTHQMGANISQRPLLNYSSIQLLQTGAEKFSQLMHPRLKWKVTHPKRPSLWILPCAPVRAPFVSSINRRGNPLKANGLQERPRELRLSSEMDRIYKRIHFLKVLLRKTRFSSSKHCQEKTDQEWNWGLGS